MCRLTSTLCDIFHLMGEVSRSPLIFVMLEVMWWVPLSQEDGSPQNKWKKLMPAAHCSDNVYALCTIPTNQSIRHLTVAKSCKAFYICTSLCGRSALLLKLLTSLDCISFVWQTVYALEATGWIHMSTLQTLAVLHVSLTCLMGSLSSCQVREGASPSGE